MCCHCSPALRLFPWVWRAAPPCTFVPGFTPPLSRGVQVLRVRFLGARDSGEHCLGNQNQNLQGERYLRKCRPSPLVPTCRCVWPVAHIINFALVPSSQRILYINIVAVFWLAFLSWTASNGGPAGAAGTAGAMPSGKAGSDERAAQAEFAGGWKEHPV